MDELTPVLYHSDFLRNWKKIEPESIHLILTDPNWGCLTSVQPWDVKPDIDLLESIFNKLLKPTGQILIFCNLDLLIELLAGFTNHFQFRFQFIWVKSGGMPVSKQRPINNVEFILSFKKLGMKEKDLTWNPYEMGERGLPYIKRNYSNDIPTRRKKKSPVNVNDHGFRFPRATLHFPSRPNMDKAERELSTQPCMKPEALIRRLVRGFSNPGDLILDPFVGSGVTLAAAYKEGRKSVGFEINKTFYLEANRRIDNLTAQEVLF